MPAANLTERNVAFALTTGILQHTTSSKNTDVSWVQTEEEFKAQCALNSYKPITMNLEVKVFSEDLLVGFEGFNYMFALSPLDMTH